MNFKLRFLVLAGANLLLLVGLFYFLFYLGGASPDIRLVDLQWNNPADRTTLFYFITSMLVVFGVNFTIGVGKTSYSEKEIEAMIEIAKHSN